MHEQVAKLQGHSHEVRYITVNKDGVLFASSSEDRTVRMWSAKTCKTLCVCEHFAEVVAISDDAKYAASGERDHVVRIWDVQGGSSVGKILDGHSDWITALHSVQTVSTSFMVQSGEPLFGHRRRVSSVFLSPCGRYIMSASFHRTVRVWDLNSEKQVGDPLKVERWLENVSVYDDNSMVVSVCLNGIVSVWDLQKRQVALKFNAHTGWPFPGRLLPVFFERNVIVCAPANQIFTYCVDQSIITSRQPFLTRT